MYQINAVGLFQVKWKVIVSSYPQLPFPVCTSYILRKTRLSYLRDRDLLKLLSAPWHMVYEGPALKYPAGNLKPSSEYVPCIVHELMWYDKYRPYYSVAWFNSQLVNVGEISAKFHYLAEIHHVSEIAEMSRVFCIFLCFSYLLSPSLLHTLIFLGIHGREFTTS